MSKRRRKHQIRLKTFSPNKWYQYDRRKHNIIKCNLRKKYVAKYYLHFRDLCLRSPCRTSAKWWPAFDVDKTKDRDPKLKAEKTRKVRTKWPICEKEDWKSARDGAVPVTECTRVLMLIQPGPGRSINVMWSVYRYRWREWDCGDVRTGLH